MRILPYRTVKDMIDGIVITFVDITKRKRDEAALRLNEKRLEALVKLSQMTAAGFEQFGSFALKNALYFSGSCWGQIALIDPAQAGPDQTVVADTQHRFTPADWPSRESSPWSEILSRSQPLIINELSDFPAARGFFPQGAEGLKRVLIVPVTDDRKIGAVAIIGAAEGAYDDYTLHQLQLFMEGLWILIVRERARNAIDRARAAAEDANLAKSQFLANTSHEIRTPLTGILGWIEMSMKASGQQEQQHYLAMAREASCHLKGLVDELLDFSKIEARKLTIDNRPFSVRLCVQSAMDLFADAAAEKGLSLAADFAEDIPEAVVGDSARLRQVMVNLLSNAVKFTPQGSIVVKVSLADRVPARPKDVVIHFSVGDTGIGIAADKMPYLFRSFSQLDSSSTRSYGGTGLGLAVSKGLVEAMGGQISADSEPGKGSLFSFSLPFTAAVPPTRTEPQPAARQRDVEAKQPLRVLLAEDNASIADLVKLMLSEMSCVVTIVGNGQQAVERCAQEDYDLIIMDVQMPKMNGLDAARAIREQEHTAGNFTPIVALTARAEKEDLLQCLAAGMNDYLAKPIDVDQLHSVIARAATGMI